MAFISTKFGLVIILPLTSLLIEAVLGEVVCDHLPDEFCAFSVSYSGKRCLLETTARKDSHGQVEHQCRTSEVVVEKMANYIETDECVKACGLQRHSVGISSDTLLDPHFLNKLCTSACYHNCPNILELYFNLAFGEGVFLPYLCEEHLANPHRAMNELASSAGVAEEPSSGDHDDYSAAFTPAPVQGNFFHYASAPAPYNHVVGSLI